MAGEIISERRARSNRNAGRHHRGFAGDFPRNPQVELIPECKVAAAGRRLAYPHYAPGYCCGV